MIRYIQHFINLVKHYFRDAHHGVKRSPKWRAVEKHWLESHPTCAACGTTEKLNVHHCMPFHLDPSLELDENNLITLCMGKSPERSAADCHIKLGHGDNFRCYNANVKADAAVVLVHPERFDEIVKLAFDNRKC